MGRDDEALTPAGPAAQVSEPAKKAGGAKAITSSMAHLRRESGLWRGLRTVTKMNKPDGFDCPGCAWPDPAHRSTFEFCENGAKALAEESTKARATPEVMAKLPIETLQTMTDYELGGLGRITEPLLCKDGHKYERVSWDEANATIATTMKTLADKDDAIFYTSGRASNEAAFLYQLLGRKWGTNNFPDCSNMCHESSGVGLGQTIGVGKGTVSLADFDDADAVFIFGQNPGTNHPRMLTTLRSIAKRGAEIVCINPLRETGLLNFKHPQKPLDVLGRGVDLATEYVQVRIGGDIAFIKGMIKALCEWHAQTDDVLDHEFIESYTEGFAAVRAEAMASSWDGLCAASGVAKSQIIRCADIYRRANASIACWAMGITQHEHGVANVREIVNLMLLKGNLGRKGAGVCPVRGHSNVQGDRTVGIDHLPADEFLDKLGQAFSFTPPRAPGLDTVHAIERMRDSKGKAFFALGGNFLSAGPDTGVIAKALRGCALTVHVATKINRSHAYPGKVSLLLPCLARSERDIAASGAQFVTVENSMSVVHRSAGVSTPASDHLRSEVRIICDMAGAILGENWDDFAANYDRIRDKIEAVVSDFSRFNERVRQPQGFVLPNSASDRDFSAVGGRAKFTVNDVPGHELAPSQLLLMTMRSHDQYNTTIYGLDDRYRGVNGGRDVIFLGEDCATARGFTAGQRVDVIGKDERIVRNVQIVFYDIPAGCAAMYFPEANPLVPLAQRDPHSHTPASKSVTITLRKHDPIAAATKSTPTGNS